MCHHKIIINYAAALLVSIVFVNQLSRTKGSPDSVESTRLEPQHADHNRDHAQLVPFEADTRPAVAGDWHFVLPADWRDVRLDEELPFVEESRRSEARIIQEGVALTILPVSPKSPNRWLPGSRRWMSAMAGTRHRYPELADRIERMTALQLADYARSLRVALSDPEATPEDLELAKFFSERWMNAVPLSDRFERDGLVYIWGHSKPIKRFPDLNYWRVSSIRIYDRQTEAFVEELEVALWVAQEEKDELDRLPAIVHGFIESLSHSKRDRGT